MVTILDFFCIAKHKLENLWFFTSCVTAFFFPLNCIKKAFESIHWSISYKKFLLRTLIIEWLLLGVIFYLQIDVLFHDFDLLFSVVFFSISFRIYQREHFLCAFCIGMIPLQITMNMWFLWIQSQNMQNPWYKSSGRHVNGPKISTAWIQYI